VTLQEFAGSTSIRIARGMPHDDCIRKVARLLATGSSVPPRLLRGLHSQWLTDWLLEAAPGSAYPAGSRVAAEPLSCCEKLPSAAGKSTSDRRVQIECGSPEGLPLLVSESWKLRRGNG
jgi:hypothetical protein